MLTNEDYLLMMHLCLRSLRMSNDLNKNQISDIENLLHKLINIRNKNTGGSNVVVRSKKVGKRARVRNP
jgi:hypothetical protein